MKFVAIFLACIVAAQAATYGCPSYDYWCSHNFHVLPARSYYCYTVPFKQCWCTSQYYADCLVEFPEPLLGGTCQEEKENVEDCIGEYETKLSGARTEIEDELNEQKTPFSEKIDDVHKVYVDAFKLYLTYCYEADTPEYNEKVAAYELELKGIKDRAIEAFETGVTAAIARIKVFHDQIIARFRSCLTQRTCRLTSYNTQIDTRASDIVSRYRTQLEAIVTKKVNFVRCTFTQLYTGKPLDSVHEDTMVAYNEELTGQVDIDVAAFQSEVDTAVEAIKESYRCNYKCYFQTGCYGFSRRSYSRSCISFPSPPKTSYKLVGVGQFKADWNGCAYNCLRTCTDEEKNCEFNDQTHIDAIAVKVGEYKETLAEKIAEWEQQVETWAETAAESLTATVQCLKPKTYCGVAPTQAEIDAFQATAQDQADRWVAAKKTALLAQIQAINTRITCQIDSWKLRAESYIAKVKAQFECCVANKTTKISSYTTSLVSKKEAAKAALESRLNCLRTQHKCQFDQFFLCAFGEQPELQSIKDLKTNYHLCVDDKVDEVIKKFDDFWAEWEPKLIEHYTCGFNCTAKVTTPCLRLCYNWNFCAPSLSGCRFYYC
jgi:hypothetical protein